MVAYLTLDQLCQRQWTWQGHTIAYTVEGDGHPLLLIHGFGASLGHWRKNIPVLAAAGYRVYALDLLGFGDSDQPPLDYSLELWQQLLYDFWQEHIHQPTVVVGNSIGGLLALMLLADHPDMARGGILLNCAGGLNHRPDELNPLLGLVMGTFSKVVSSPVGPLLFNEVRRKFRIRGSLKQVYCDSSAITDELVEMIHRPACRPGAQKVFASVLTAPAGPKPEDLLPRIAQPMLVLWGDADPWTPIKGAEVYRQQAATGAPIQVHPIPQAGHCPHDECPDTVNPLIVDWLAGL